MTESLLVSDVKKGEKLRSQQLVERKRLLILNRIFTGLSSYGKGNVNKKIIPTEFIDYLYGLHMKLTGGGIREMHGIHIVYLLPNFDGKRGYALMIDRHSYYTKELFAQDGIENIARCTASYEIRNGTPNLDDGRFQKLQVEIGSTVGGLIESRGPDYPDRNRRPWKGTIGTDRDAIVLTMPCVGQRNKAKNDCLFISSRASRSAQQLIDDLENKKTKTNSRLRFMDVRKNLSSHYKNSTKNNQRIAADVQRFFKINIDQKDDHGAYKKDVSHAGPPQLGIPDVLNQSNVLTLNADMDWNVYKNYVMRMIRWRTGKSDLQKLSLYPGITGGPGVLSYFSNSSPYLFYSQMKARKKENYDRKIRTLVTQRGRGRSIRFYVLKRKDLMFHPRFFAIPTFIPLFQRTREKYIDKSVGIINSRDEIRLGLIEKEKEKEPTEQNRRNSFVPADLQSSAALAPTDTVYSYYYK